MGASGPPPGSCAMAKKGNIKAGTGIIKHRKVAFFIPVDLTFFIYKRIFNAVF
jgi:hypothetical protein